MWAKGRCASQASLVLAVECLRSNAPDLEHASALGRGNVWTRTRTDLEGDAVRAHAEQRSCCLSDDEDEGEAGRDLLSTLRPDELGLKRDPLTQSPLSPIACRHPNP
eukprot:1386752-Rhodomonas_salina.1